MITEEIIIKKITPKKGFLLTNGETITDTLFMGFSDSSSAWWEIPNENYIPEFDGSDYIYPIAWEPNLEVKSGLWYTDNINIWEAIRDGIPADFNDEEFFNIIK